MTAGVWAPLPPARTGIADYAASLIAAMQRYGSVAVNRDGDVNVYHLGNNNLHRAIYERALTRPGIAVLHDAVLQHFFLGSLTEQQYVDEFTYNYGTWNASTASRLWQERARSGSDERYFHYPMLKRVAERSRAVIVHNPAAMQIVREHAPAARVYEIPHFFEAPPVVPSYEVERLRATWNLRAGERVFGVFGYLRESKRLRTVLRAFEEVRASQPMRLLIAGQFVSSDLQRALAPELAGPGIIRVPYLPDREFWLHAAAVHACLNLRYPAAGETSGIATRLLGIGKPVIATAGPEVSRLPLGAILPVDVGPSEREMLAAYMLWIARWPEQARAGGELGAAYIREHHGVETAAQHYWQAIRDCYDGSNP